MRPTEETFIRFQPQKGQVWIISGPRKLIWSSILAIQVRSKNRDGCWIGGLLLSNYLLMTMSFVRSLASPRSLATAIKFKCTVRNTQPAPACALFIAHPASHEDDCHVRHVVNTCHVSRLNVTFNYKLLAHWQWSLDVVMTWIRTRSNKGPLWS